MKLRNISFVYAVLHLFGIRNGPYIHKRWNYIFVCVCIVKYVVCCSLHLNHIFDNTTKKIRNKKTCVNWFDSTNSHLFIAEHKIYIYISIQCSMLNVQYTEKFIVALQWEYIWRYFCRNHRYVFVVVVVLCLVIINKS